MPSETVSEGIAFVPPFLHHGQCGPVDSSPRFSSPKKNGFPAINRHGGKPVAIPVQTSPPCLSPQAEKSGRQFAPFFLSEKKRLFRNQRGMTATNRCNTRPDFSSAPLSASRKIRLTVRPAFPLRKKTVFLQSTGTAANPFNNRPDFSSVPLPASRKIRLTVRPAFPLRKKTAFLQSTGTAANPLQYPSRLLCPLTINGLPCFV